MSGTAKPQSSDVYAALRNLRKDEFHDFLPSISDDPDFHDPFSELNLFLSQEIKEFMRSCGCSKKWSSKIQEELLDKITPKFQKRFPHLRLGIAALKKSWEKISHFLQQIQSEKDAITQDGKLNLSFFIKSNLKQLPSVQGTLHPSLFAHQLAVKISGCMAAVDGTRPKLDQLTKMIWSLQRHLIPHFDLTNSKSSYDECDKIDKLIIKIILDFTVKFPQISQMELEHRVKEALQSLQELPSFASQDAMTANIAALLADKMTAPATMVGQTAILNFIRRQMTLCKSSSPTLQHTDLVRRILALYALASQMPKDLQDAEIEAAVRAVYPIAGEFKPVLPQSIYAFISAEMVLAKTEEYCHSVDFVCESIKSAYQEAKLLPILQGKDLDFLEVTTWKFLTESEGLLEKLPYKIGHRIEEEMANVLIDHPHQSFNSVIQKTVQFFQQIKELTQSKKWTEIERKIHNWIIQSEMIYRAIQLDSERPLLQLIVEKSKTLKHKELICEVTHAYLTQHPELIDYAPQLQLRIQTLYKYTWYKQAPEDSSFDRFIKWYSTQGMNVEELCKKMLPLVPYVLPKEENKSQNNEGQTQVLTHI